MKEWEIDELEDQINDTLLGFSLLREEPGIKEDIKAELLDVLVLFIDKRRLKQNGSGG